MTIEEIITLINKKLISAEDDLESERQRKYPQYKKQQRLIGEMEAYIDLLEIIRRKTDNNANN